MRNESDRNATAVQLEQSLTPTPPEIMQRYRENPNPNLYQKEWIYHNFPPAGTIWLDFGCGTGEITTQLALLGARRVFAVDVTQPLVGMTQQRAELDGVADRVRCICGDITTLRPESVDVALAFAVLHHVPDQIEQVVRAIARWLKPGGIFIFSEPVSYLPMLEWMRNHSGVQAGDRDPGERKLTQHDLELIGQQFSKVDRLHFHVLGRLSRLFPSLDHQFRKIDALLRHIPGSGILAGSVLGVCRK